MPVTAKLSRKFYERFGDDIAGELVDWFNAVDTTYKSDLKEINDLNWQRIDTRFESIDTRFESMEARIDTRFESMEAHLNSESSSIKAELRGEFRTGLADLRSELLKWMFIYWTGSVVTLGGLMYTLLQPR